MRSRDNATPQRKEKEPRGSFFCFRGPAAGFTSTELIAVITIAGILAAVVIPRFTGASFDEARLQKETLAALRDAQRTAIAYQRTVCATFTATQLTLSYDATYGGTTCAATLPPPAGSGTAYVVTRTGAAAYSSATSFHFDRIGRPSLGQTITLNAGSSIIVEAETGYVH